MSYFVNISLSYIMDSKAAWSCNRVTTAQQFHHSLAR